MKRNALMFVAAVVAGMAFADPPAGMKWETEAIQAQIDAAAAKGGGRVTVPKGIHPCRTLYLKSGVELHLEKDAVILGGPDQPAGRYVSRGAGRGSAGPL